MLFGKGNVLHQSIRSVARTVPISFALGHGLKFGGVRRGVYPDIAIKIQTHDVNIIIARISCLDRRDIVVAAQRVPNNLHFPSRNRSYSCGDSLKCTHPILNRSC